MTDQELFIKLVNNVHSYQIGNCLITRDQAGRGWGVQHTACGARLRNEETKKWHFKTQLEAYKAAREAQWAE